MNLKTVLALVIASAFAAPVLAQSAGRGVEGKDTGAKGANPAAPSAGATASSFATMDRNNDGHLSRDEVRDAPWNNRFSELDQDNDSRISQSEFAVLGKAAAGATGQQEKRK
jgi:EF hand